MTHDAPEVTDAPLLVEGWMVVGCNCVALALLLLLSSELDTELDEPVLEELEFEEAELAVPLVVAAAVFAPLR